MKDTRKEKYERKDKNYSLEAKTHGRKKSRKDTHQDGTFCASFAQCFQILDIDPQVGPQTFWLSSKSW